jgi:hypothetical protein
MASHARILANRANAKSSTGPVTAEGKARCSGNAITSGLFSQHDLVLAAEADIYREFCAAYQADLAPVGAVENTLAAEIFHAAWRLRRCSAVEGQIGPGETQDESEAIERSVERARSSALKVFNRALAELRRVQTERHLRNKLPEQDGVSALGVASCREIDAFLKPAELLESAPPQPLAVSAKQTQSDPEPEALTPRGAPCPCGSGQKFKRCCGKEAPPLLTMAA